jgi:hypothetical protein
VAERRDAPLWTCPRCGRTFANTNQTHACGRHELEPPFARCEPHVRALFEAFAEAVRANHPGVVVIPEKTRVAFHLRMSFAAVTPRRRWLDGHLVLAERVDEPWVRGVEAISPRNQVHRFRLAAPEDLDARLRARIADAVAVGEQRHLDRRT